MARNENPGNDNETAIGEANYTAIFNAANDGIFVHDIETGQIIDVNQKTCEMYLYPKDELIRLKVSDISAGTPPYTQSEAMRMIRKAADGEPQLFEWLARDRVGRLFWVEVNLKRAVISGKYRLLAIVREITERKRTEERLARLNDVLLNFGTNPQDNIDRLTALLGELLNADCALYNRLEGQTIRSCSAWNVPAGFQTVGTAKGHICYDVVKKGGDEVAVVRDLQNTDYAKTDPNVCRYKLQIYMGRAVKFSGSYVGTLCVVYQRDLTPSEEDKKVMGLIASAIGIEEERRFASDILMENEARYRGIVEDQTELICRFKPGGAITFVNEAYCRYFNKRHEDLIGKKFFPFIPAQDLKRVKNNLASLSVKKPFFTHEHRVTNGDGRMRWQQWTNRAIFDNRGRIIEIQAVGRDITEGKGQEARLQSLYKELMRSNKRLNQLALKDPQTGLYNYRYLNEVIEPEFYRARRYAHPISVIMIDIDYFKSINDVYGHEFGDMVLRQFSGHLKKMVRHYDIAIRLGGDEFAVISPGADRLKTLVLAQRLLDAFNQYDYGDKKHAVNLKVSIAVAAYPYDSINRAMDLVNLAEKILDRAKEAGGNRVYSSLDINNGKYTAIEKGGDSADVKSLKERIQKLTVRGKQNLIESIFAFAKTIELKDHGTGEHVERTVHYATEMAMALNLPPEEIENIKEAAVLHDLGKIGISDRILLKKTKLTKKEFEEIKKHPQIAADIIRPIQFMHDIIPLVLYHHEKWDGKGYPAGLKGEEIPIGARIIAVADVYQALTSDRPYRKAYSKKEAIHIIKDGSGAQFDPLVVATFLKVIKKEKR